MTESMKEKVVTGVIVGGTIVGLGVLIYLGTKSHNKFAKYVMEHPEEYKLYQNVERMKNLETEVGSLRASNSEFRKTNDILTKRCEAATDRLKGYVKKEYAEFFDIPEVKAD